MEKKRGHMPLHGASPIPISATYVVSSYTGMIVQNLNETQLFEDPLYWIKMIVITVHL